jgi:deoxyuridine 5'-triphosphate nucleotidohydrolase
MELKEFELNIFKARDVKTPEKFGNAAGWDFYIPNDLTISDFMGCAGLYINEFIKQTITVSTNVYLIPLEFTIDMDGVDTVYMIKVIKDKDELKTEVFKKETNVFDNFLNNFPLEENEVSKILSKVIKNIRIMALSKILIPSGIHVRLPEEVFLVAENKSGIASKRGLIKGAQVIDCDYQGQIHINLINPMNTCCDIKPGEKIVQFVPYFQPKMTKVVEFETKESLYADTESVRGEGGFGSSGIK